MTTTKLLEILGDCILFSLKSFIIAYIIATMICGISLWFSEGTLIGFILACILLPDIILSEYLPFLLIIIILRVCGLWNESFSGSRRAWIFAISSYFLYFISIYIDFDSIYEIENTTDDFIVSCVILIIWTPIFLLIPKHLLERYTSEDEEDE